MRPRILRVFRDFIGSVQKLRLTIKKSFKTIEDVRKWIDRQVSASLAMLSKHYGNNEFVTRLIKRRQATFKVTSFCHAYKQ